MRHVIKGLCSAAIGLSLAVLPSTAALAQETVNYSSVSGRVTDTTGGILPGVTVTARHVDTNVASTATTDEDGRFRFPYLRVGTYDITFTLSGFKTAARRLTLTVGSAYDLPVRMEIGALETTVTVNADATLIETARSQIAATISHAEVQALPMNGRNFLDLALLAPGVAPPNVGGGSQLFAETSAVAGAGLSIGSQRNFSNSFIVDGLSANDDAAGLGGMSYGVDAIDQFQVVTSGGQAELGRALGGYVNIVTRSGTNAFKGDAYGYFRDDRFNAANALTGTRLPMHQNQYGANLGGPIAHDRTFFFTNVERRSLEQSGLVTIAPANVAAISARLAAVGYGGPPIATGVYANPVETTNAVGKVDQQVRGTDHFSVRYSLYDVSSSNSRGAGALSAPSASAGLDNRDQTIAFSNIAAVSDRTVFDTRAQFAYSDLQAPPTDPVGPAVSISGVASFGTLSFSPTGRVNRMFEIVNNVSHQRGAHALRAGVDFLYNDLTITFPRAVRGSYTFSSLANFLAGRYNNAGFSQTFGDTAVTQTNPNLGVYAQDEWRVNARLTLNLGLRYDLQWLETINTDTNNVSPRIGVVWSPDDAGRTVVRASAGLYYDRVPLRALANALLSAGNTTDLGQLRQVAISLSPSQAGAPAFPDVLAAPIASVTLPNLSTMDRNLQNAYSRQAGVEVERQIGPQSTISIGYQHLTGRHLLIAVNQNVPSCVASGGNNGCRPNADYGNNSQYSSIGHSNYNALTVSFVQRPASWGSYRVSYTLSKSMNDVGEAFFSQPIDPFDISKDWGRSDDDQRHRLVVSGALRTPASPATTLWQRLGHGFEVSGMLQYYSALPFNITSGVTTIQGTAERPIVDGRFIPRNSGVGSPFSTVSLRLSRALPVGPHVRVEGLVEAFNLFNRRNDVARNGNFGSGTYPSSPSSSFGDVTAVGDPRTFQFGFRVRF